MVDSLSGKKFGSQDVSNIPTWTVFLSSPPLFGTISVENKILAPRLSHFVFDAFFDTLRFTFDTSHLDFDTSPLDFDAFNFKAF